MTALYPKVSGVLVQPPEVWRPFFLPLNAVVGKVPWPPISGCSNPQQPGMVHNFQLTSRVDRRRVVLQLHKKLKMWHLD